MNSAYPVQNNCKVENVFRMTNMLIPPSNVADPVFFGHPDPDPDPGKYRIRIIYPQKDPMLFKFSRYKIVLNTVSSKEFFYFWF